MSRPCFKVDLNSKQLTPSDARSFFNVLRMTFCCVCSPVAKPSILLRDQSSTTLTTGPSNASLRSFTSARARARAQAQKLAAVLPTQTNPVTWIICSKKHKMPVLLPATYPPPLSWAPPPIEIISPLRCWSGQLSPLLRPRRHSSCTTK